MRICVVDDNEAVLDAMALWLSDAGNELVLARTGAQAQAQVQAAALDFVITDVNLPDMSGVDLARALRAVRPSLAILLISGQAQLSGGAIGADAADGFLTKPFTPKALTAALRQAQQSRLAA